jgi:hypothetical protein
LLSSTYSISQKYKILKHFELGEMDTPQVVPHSDLEVAGPKPRFSDNYQAQPFQAAQYEKHQGDLYGPSNLRKDRTICGLRPTTFFLLLALILVILAAAVGGGVGGSIALSNAKR